MFFLQDRIFRLKGQVQHYAWGGFEFIPQWLGTDNREHLPFAEYWMGAHPLAPSTLDTRNGALSLAQLIRDNPVEMITQKIFDRFGGLPFLFKILDVREMLSIQVHPHKSEAEKGFDYEEAQGIPVGSANRNYKDRNHKPEMMVALSPFWLLHGFMLPEKLTKSLLLVPELENLVPLFEKEGYKGLYRYVMELQQPEVNRILAPLIEREGCRKREGLLDRSDPGWWVTKLYPGKVAPEEIDRGVFSLYFFNIVSLQPGEAVFQGAGLPHAYLEGQNAELMANSDNVLRGGLTPKHVDVPELLKHIAFEGIEPCILPGKDRGGGEKIYPCPVSDFGISKIALKPGESYHSESSSLEMLAVMKGTLTLRGSSSLNLTRGEAGCILPGEHYEILPGDPVEVFKAFVP